MDPNNVYKCKNVASNISKIPEYPEYGTECFNCRRINHSAERRFLKKPLHDRKVTSKKHKPKNVH